MKVTLILNFNVNRREKRFDISEYKTRVSPFNNKEKIWDLKLDDNECYDAIFSECTFHGEVLPKCHIFLDDELTIRAVYGDIASYYPFSIVIMGIDKLASEDEVLQYKIVAPDEMERRKKEIEVHKRLVEEPDLSRFSNLDLEE